MKRLQQSRLHDCSQKLMMVPGSTTEQFAYLCVVRMRKRMKVQVVRFMRIEHGVHQAIFRVLCNYSNYMKATLPHMHVQITLHFTTHKERSVLRSRIWIIDSLQPDETALYKETYRRSKVAQCSRDKRLCVSQTAGYQCNHHLLATQAR
jgi:hypothetical protein